MTKLSERGESESEREESQEDIEDNQTVREEKKGDEFNKREGTGEERLKGSALTDRKDETPEKKTTSTTETGTMKTN